MDELSSIFTPSPNSAAARANEPASAELGQQDFLRMLIAQLENQDPLNPQDATEFTAQLATFSNLEQMLAIRQGIDSLVALQNGQSSENSSLAETLAVSSLIGREVVAEGSLFSIDKGSDTGPSLIFDLPQAANSVSVAIADPRTNQVFGVVDFDPLTQGRHELSYADLQKVAKDLNLPNGTYKFVVNSSFNDDPVTSTRFVRAVVDGANLDRGNPVVMLGDVVVPVTEIQEIRRQEGS